MSDVQILILNVCPREFYERNCNYTIKLKNNTISPQVIPHRMNVDGKIVILGIAMVLLVENVINKSAAKGSS